MQFLSKSVEETAQITIDFGANLKSKEKGATVVGLYGELGSGKTTFMKYLAECFGIKETIKSPTFVIMRKHQTSPPRKLPFSSPPPLAKGRGLGGEDFQNLIHIDAYRIEKEEEMLSLGWEKLISDSKNLICIEWADKIAGIMPPHIVITFEHSKNETERKISVA